MKTIKTVKWTESEELFTVSARQSFGKTRHAHPKNFLEFIDSYNSIPLKAMKSLLERVIVRHELNDVTKWAEMSEDSCLLAVDANEPLVLSIVDAYLRQLNTGAQVPALWCYVDDEKKVVAHFINRKGYFVELYVQSEEEASVLHLVESDDDKKYFVPVLFTADITHYTQATDLRGAILLHDYLPREKFDCLSNGGKKHLNGHTFAKNGNPVSDGGDSL